MKAKTISRKNLFQSVAMIALGLGAAGSIRYMFKVGSNQKSLLIMAFFAIWVLSPFVGLIILNKISKRMLWSARAILYSFMVITTIGSLIAYSGILIPMGTKPAFIFLVTPLISLLLIFIVFLLVKKFSNKNTYSNGIKKYRP